MRKHRANTRLNEFEFRQGRIALRSWPQVIDLGLTLKCNLKCEMCFSRAMPAIDLAPECLEKAVPYLDYCHRIVWNDAGELFASSRTAEFIELMKRHRPPRSYVSTNLLLIDRHIDDILDSGLNEMNVSIDAIRRETYERIRTGARWDKLIANLGLLQRKKAERNTPWPALTFVFVAMRSNLAELPEFVDFAGKYGAVAIHVLKMLPTPHGLEREEQPDFEAEKAAYTKALLRARDVGLEIQHTFFNNDALLAELGEERAADAPSAARAPAGVSSPEPTPSPPVLPDRLALEALHRRQFAPACGVVPICQAPWSEFLIQTDGKVRACCFSPAVMGDLHRQSLPEIWNGPEYRAFRRRLVVRDFSTCRDCPYLAKMLVLAEDPLERSLMELERRAAEHGRWIERYAGDVNWLADYARRWRRGPRRQALRETGTALRTAARLAWKNLFLKPALARAWVEQRWINNRLLEAARLAQQRARRMREDAEILAEAAVARARPVAQAVQPVKVDAAQDVAQAFQPVNIDAAQDPVDALFYSVQFLRHATPESLMAGREVKVSIALRNTSALEWPTEGDHAVKLAYSWHYDNGALHELDGLRTPLGKPLRPGETVRLEAALRAPARPGRYLLVWDLVYDPYAWFKDRGSLPLEVEITVEPGRSLRGTK